MKDLKTSFLKLFNRTWPIIFLLAISLLFFYPVWLKNYLPLPLDALVAVHIPWTEIKWEGYPTGVPIKNLEITDSISQFYPWRSLVGEFWRSGKVPLWNPYMFSGAPFLATLHSASLYPLNFLYLFLSNEKTWSLLLFLQIFLAGVFMYLFLRTLKLRPEVSLLGSIAFAFSGYMIGWLEFATGGQAAMWFPLLLLLEYKLVTSKKFFWILPISLVFFFIYTAGDFQVPLYTTIVYVLFGIFLVWPKKVFDSHFFKGIILIFAGFLSGVFLSLPQLLPTIELFRQSVRFDDPYIKEYFYGLMDWNKITNFIWPDFFGNVVTGNSWGRFSFHEYVSFTGVVSLVFAVYSFLTKKEKVEKFFWFLLVLSLIFLFPTPLAYLPFKLKIPGLGTSSASRIIFLVDFCLSVLASYGLSRWIKKKELNILKIINIFFVITAGVALGLVISIAFIKVLSENSILVVPYITNLLVSLRNIIPTSLVLLTLFLLFLVREKFPKPILKIFPFLIIVVAAAEMLRFSWKNTSFSPQKFLYPKTQTTDYLEKQTKPFRIAGGIPTNLFIPYKIDSIEGYDPIYPLQYANWLSVVNFGLSDYPSRRYGLVSNFSSPILNYANLEYVIDFKKGFLGDVNNDGSFNPSIIDSHYQPVFSEGRVTVFKNSQALPRVWVSTNYKVGKDDSEIIKELIKPESSRNKLIIIKSEPSIKITRKNTSFSVSNFQEDFNKVTFDVSMEDNALVFLSQNFYSGWRAYDNGKEVEILKANYVFDAIAATKGNHEIEFIYDPKSFKIGKLLSITTLTFLIGFLFIQKLSKK